MEAMNGRDNKNAILGSGIQGCKQCDGTDVYSEAFYSFVGHKFDFKIVGRTVSQTLKVPAENIAELVIAPMP